MSALIVDNGWQQPIAKDQEESHMTPIINEGERQTISDLITQHHEKDGGLGPDRMLFTSKQGRWFCLSRSQAHKILCEAFHRAHLNDKVTSFTSEIVYEKAL